MRLLVDGGWGFEPRDTFHKTNNEKRDLLINSNFYSQVELGELSKPRIDFEPLSFLIFLNRQPDEPNTKFLVLAN